MHMNNLHLWLNVDYNWGKIAGLLYEDDFVYFSASLNTCPEMMKKDKSRLPKFGNFFFCEF